MNYSQKIKLYYNLAKPGIVYGNLLTAAGGYLLASEWNDLGKGVIVLIGSSLVVGGACVFNNILDRKVDKAMKRTSSRALVKGEIGVKQAFVYGSVIEIAGLLAIGLATNKTTLALAILGLVFYDLIYTPAKRKTVYSTIIGAVSGSLPPVIGYTAFSGSIDTTAVLLFLMMIFWQLAHFYAIGLYRLEEYKEAKLPIWPIVKGISSTKTQIMVSILLFSVFAVSLSILGSTGYLFLLIMLIVGFGWFSRASRYSRFLQPKDWGKRVFMDSLIVILLTSAALSVGRILP